jgi:UPF0755 protein
MKKLAWVLLLVSAAAVVAGYSLLQRVEQPFRGYETEAQLVTVPAGASTTTIGDTLVDAGVVRDPTTFSAARWRTGEARRLKAGDYRVDHPMSARDVIGKIARGDVDQLSVTFREGLTLTEMAAIAAASQIGTAEEFLRAARDTSAIQDLDPSARDLEGYLFPDTYLVPRRTDAARLVAIMVARFKEVFTPALREAASRNGMTTRQFVTLASIVEKETGAAEERPTVAAVYRNRLKVKMGLQCDPTVIYALQKAGRYNGNLRREDLEFDSPYNTYRYAGLPPGPIAAPGRASLEAVANPADVTYLYCVSRNDGTHAFASSLDEHNRNVQKYQVEYFRGRRGGSGR